MNIHVNNISKSYPINRKKSVQALKNVSFKINENSVFGLLGVNGAGKTTMIKILTTLLYPDDGSFEIGELNGKQIKKIRKIVNYVSGAERQLYNRLTVLENLEYFSALHGNGRKETKKILEDLIPVFNLEELLPKRVETLSQGMKQRVKIARALVNNPKFLLMDEPTVGLDINIARNIRNFIKNELMVNRKCTILLTTHYINEAEYLCDKIGILHDGELIIEATPGELKKLAKNDLYIELTVENCIKADNILKGYDIKECKEIDNYKTLKILIQNEDEKVNILRTFFENGLKIHSITANTISLEDALLSIIKGRSK